MFFYRELLKTKEYLHVDVWWKALIFFAKSTIACCASTNSLDILNVKYPEVVEIEEIKS